MSLAARCAGQTAETTPAEMATIVNTKSIPVGTENSTSYLGASHFLMLSKPDVVAGVTREAVMACAANLVA